MNIKCLFLLSLSLSGCMAQIPTLQDYGNSAIGLNISVIRDLVRRPGSRASQQGWQEQTYPLPNGHWVYVEPDRPNCEIHYEVSSADIILGFTPVGTGCKYQ